HPQTHELQDQNPYYELADTKYINFTNSSSATSKRVSKSRRASPSQSEGGLIRKATNKSAKAKGKQRVKQDEPLLDDDWERELKSKILSDEDLHLRILRYEPIHFDVFLKKVTTGEKPSGKLKLALRTFLDKQAVNFYGAEPSGRRR
ncbi:hypothetical protein HWV62_43056, partial [Athelia sp. TMB]